MKIFLLVASAALGQYGLYGPTSGFLQELIKGYGFGKFLDISEEELRKFLVRGLFDNTGTVLNHDIQRAMRRAYMRAIGILKDKCKNDELIEGQSRVSAIAFFDRLLATADNVFAIDKLSTSQVEKLIGSDQTFLDKLWEEIQSEVFSGMHPLVRFEDLSEAEQITATSVYTPEFKNLIKETLLGTTAFLFGEELKKDSTEGTKAWRAFQRSFLEGLSHQLTLSQNRGLDFARIVDEKQSKKLQQLFVLMESLKQGGKLDRSFLATEFANSLLKLQASMHVRFDRLEVKVDKLTYAVAEFLKRSEPVEDKLYFPVPPLPSRYFSRHNYIREIGNSLIDSNFRSVAVTNEDRYQGLLGMGGIGKTTICIGLAHDRRIRRKFSDGVIWLDAGRDRDEDGVDLATDFFRLHRQTLSVRLSDLQDKTPKGATFSRERAIGQLIFELTREKKYLIIVDDVWKGKQLNIFKTLGPECRLLVTTRVRDVIRKLDAKEHMVNVLEPDKALDFLLVYVGRKRENLQAKEKGVLEEICKASGFLPLALAIVGSMMQDGDYSPEDLLKKLLDANNQKDLRAVFPNYLPGSLRVALQISFDDLGNKMDSLQEAYLDYVVFDPQEPIPSAAFFLLLQQRFESEEQARQAANWLVRRSLLTRADGVYRIHDMNYAFIEATCMAANEDQYRRIQQAHISLVEAYRKECENIWHRGPADGYFFKGLQKHLRKSGSLDELLALQYDYNWLRAKLDHTTGSFLVKDYQINCQVFKDSNDMAILQLVLDALKLSSYAINKDRSQLEGQLIGRLKRYEVPVIKELLKQARENKTDPWLRLVTDTLVPPGQELKQILEEHEADVRCFDVVKLRSGWRLASGSDDCDVRIWDVETGVDLRLLSGHSARVNAIVINSSSLRIYSACEKGEIRVWAFDRDQALQVIHTGRGAISALLLLPDEKTLLCGSEDGSITVWDIDGNRQMAKATAIVDAYQYGGVGALALNSDGTLLASGCNKRIDKEYSSATVRIWNVQENYALHKELDYRGQINDLVFSRDSQKLVTASNDFTAKIWDLNTESLLHTLKTKEEGRELHYRAINSLAVSTDNRYVLTGGDDHYVLLWNLETGAFEREIGQHSNAVHAVNFLTELDLIVSSSNDSTLRIWKFESGDGDHSSDFEKHKGWVRDIAVDANKGIAISASQDATLRVWNLEQRVVTLPPIDFHDGQVEAVCLLALSPLAASASVDKTIKVWNYETGELINSFKAHKETVSSVVAVPNSNRILSGAYDDLVKLWDLGEDGTQNQLIKVFEGHEKLQKPSKGIRHLAVNATGTMAASGGDDGQIILYDLHQNVELVRCSAHASTVRSISFSKDGTLIASGSEDRSVKVWSTEDLGLIHTIEDHYKRVRGTHFVAGDRFLVSLSSDKTIKVWDLHADFSHVATFFGNGAITSFKALSDRQFMAGEVEGYVHFLTLENI